MSMFPRIRHLRHRSFDRVRHSEKTLDWLAARVTALTGTGTGVDFTATVAAVAASGLLTFVENAEDGDTVTIGSETYTFQGTLTDVDGNIHIGVDAAATRTNLLNAINATGGTPGTDFALSNTIHPTVSAGASGGNLTVTAKSTGRGGNAIVTTEVSGDPAQVATGRLAFSAKANDGDTVTIDTKTYTFRAAVMAGVAATSVLTLTENAADTNTVTIDSKVYTFQDAAVAGVAATSVLTLTENAADTNTVTIDSKVYTFEDELSDADGNVHIGASASDTLDNLIAAITLGAGAGTAYATSMTEHPTCGAAAGAGDTMDLTADTVGTAGNSIVTTDTLAGSSAWTAGTMAGGVDVAGDGAVKIGASASDTLDNLIAAIDLGAGSGTAYAAAMTELTSVTAAAGAGDTLDLTAAAVGTAGNSIATTDTLAGSSAWTAGTMAGGVDVAVDGHVLIGADADASRDNLAAAIDLDAGAGTTYATAMTELTTVTAATGVGDIDLTSTVLGAAGNAIVTTETSSVLAFDAATLEGGVSNVSFGAATLESGEYSSIFSAAAHGFVSGDGPVTVSSTTTLPAGLVAGEQYFVSKIDANTFQLAPSIAGEALPITTAGTGTHTVVLAAETTEDIFKWLLNRTSGDIHAATDVDTL